MTYSYYILLYTTIYDYCTQNRPQVTTFGAGMRGGASLQGADLYRSLNTYLSDHARQLKEVGA
jgi:cullin 1